MNATHKHATQVHTIYFETKCSLKQTTGKELITSVCVFGDIPLVLKTRQFQTSIVYYSWNLQLQAVYFNEKVNTSHLFSYGMNKSQGSRTIKYFP